ncbi:hypothetical protein C9I98_07205 [Photobacterium sanctipauli]|uniref:Uncharacterized protein n=2 Tax=Photobacterium sanctipauli TaxID=1342794 RepID=A0A2T3NWP0_9GAMM|nr:hypothetical protein C9I98_07205 [Photobacterium sanctipauli]
MFKLSFIEEILDSLSASCFSEQDFDLVFPNAGSVVEIIFKHDESYSFIVYESEISEMVKVSNSGELSPLSIAKSGVFIEISVKPGHHKHSEVWSATGFTELPDLIIDWCHCIKEELESKFREKCDLDIVRKNIDDNIHFFIKDDGSRFDIEEVNSIKKSFDRLYAYIEDNRIKFNFSINELKVIKEQFDYFIANASFYPRNLWFKLMSNKIIDLLCDVIKSKQGKELIFIELKQLVERGNGK